MLINWFTVCAQAINFLILVWLLKRFLYKPILHAIDERERGIAAQLAAAEAHKALAQKERDQFQHKNQVFNQERAALLKQATDLASVERQRLLGEARNDADALRAKRQAALRTEQVNLNQEIVGWTQKEVFAITRKVLADLASTSLEERMGDVFVRRLSALTGAARAELTDAFNTSNHQVSVRSAFDLPSAQKIAIECAVNETFGPDARVQFEMAPVLIGGIELSVNGRKIAWSIADYLATLEKSAGKLLHQDFRPEPTAERKAVSQPDPKTDPRPGPKGELRNGPAPVAAAPKADH